MFRSILFRSILFRSARCGPVAARRAAPAARRAAAAACAVAAGALLLAPAAQAAAATPPRTTTNPAAAAAGWLAQQFSDAAHQRVPGGDHIDLSYTYGGKTQYYFDGGTTADAIFALAATRSGADKIDAAARYLATHLDAYVDYSGAQGGPYYGSVGKAAVAAMVAGDDPNDFGGHHLLTELKQNECGDSDPHCTPGANSNVASSVATSFIVIAEARGAARDGAAYAPSANLVRLLLGEQCPDGGFPSAVPVKGTCSPDVDSTGYAVMALQALGGHQRQLAAATRFLLGRRSPSGAWTEQGGPNIDSTGLAAAALSITGHDTSGSRRWLAAQQVTAGPTAGAGASRGALRYEGGYDPNSSIKATADGILGLVPGTSLATLTARGASPGTAVLPLAAPTLDGRTVAAGGTDTVTGTGFGAHERVSVTLHSATVDLGTARADAAGTVRLRFTVPGRLAAGTHTLVLTGLRTGLSSTRSLPVGAAVRPAAGSGAPALAATGRDSAVTLAEVAVGIGCIAAGAAALRIGRRRART